MKVLIATSEAVPFAKTGGLADVAGSLYREYGKTATFDAALVLPLYREVREKFALRDTGLHFTIPVGAKSYPCRVWLFEPSVYFLEGNEFFDRAELYGTAEGDYPDNAARFTFFNRAVLEACMALGLKPDVIHCNDWQTGLIPLYLKTVYRNEFFRETASVLTIHNLGYQGLFGAVDFPLTGLGSEWFNPAGVEFYGKVNFLKAGIIAADRITTVSRTYAREILTPEFGYGLDGVLRTRSRDLSGIVNGIDVEEWDPARDPAIPARYGPSDLKGKATCRKRLVEECSLRLGGSDAPLVALVGRLSTQKGLDLFIEVADEIVASGIGVIIFGKGDESLQEKVRGLGAKHAGAVYARIGYDESFAHRIYAGSDLFLMPSQYEPCGLGQMIAMRYGTVPVARKTGGLADTIVDHDALRGEGTGFLFEEYRPKAMRDCLKRALCVFVDRRRWTKMLVGAMKTDFSWEKSARQYIGLYHSASGMKGALRPL
jgi:starch synthase